MEGFFSDSKKILLLLEYPLISLKREFHNRLLNRLQFDREEITRILYSAIRGYAAVERAGGQNSKVRMAHIFVGVQAKESTVKVIDSGLLGAASNLQCLILNGPKSNEHHDVYLSPEEFRAYFAKNNLGGSPNSGVFSLGATVLDLCLMDSSSSAYHFQRRAFEEAEVRNLVKIAGKKHGSNLEKFLLDMLEFDCAKRPSFVALEARIPSVFGQSAVGGSALRLSVVRREESGFLENDAKSLRNSRAGSVYSSRSSQSAGRVFASSIQAVRAEEEELENIHEEYTNGNQYIGQKKGGLKHGRGKYIFKDRSYYEGSWRNNLMHGKGVLYLPNGKVEYEGEWAEDEPDGWGLYYCYEAEGRPPLWRRYEGQLRRGEMDGRGKLLFASGLIYEGEFRLGKIFGRGKKISEEGVVVEREWPLQTLEEFARSCQSSAYVREE